jgi:hypothetical protein
MPGTRLALVADDQLLASAVQVNLKKILGGPAYQCRFDAARTLLGRDTDAILVLAAASGGGPRKRPPPREKKSNQKNTPPIKGGKGGSGP